VLDLPEACEIGRELVTQSGFEDRIHFVSGDLTRDDLVEKATREGPQYDFVFMFNILHHFDAQTKQNSLKKLFMAMNPAGRLVILDLFKQRKEQRQLPALAALFFMVTSGGGIYSFDETKRWLAAAGFERCRVLNLLTVPGASLVLADKPGGREI
jgi:SAM-dependent methyltransferase